MNALTMTGAVVAPFGRKHGLRPHGTESRYKQGCRCDPCRITHNALARARARLNPKPLEERRAEYLRWHAERPLYAIWRGMKIRCLSPKHHEFHRYGGRGIQVHAPWRDSYERFEAEVLAAIGPRASVEMTIDRINNDGHYEPGNVRWQTRSEQSTNKTHARGAAQGLSKLNDDSVFAIRRLWATTLFTQPELGRWFGVGRTNISKIIQRKIWRHVP